MIGVAVVGSEFLNHHFKVFSPRACCAGLSVANSLGCLNNRLCEKAASHQHGAVVFLSFCSFLQTPGQCLLYFTCLHVWGREIHLLIVADLSGNQILVDNDALLGDTRGLRGDSAVATIGKEWCCLPSAGTLTCIPFLRRAVPSTVSPRSSQQSSVRFLRSCTPLHLSVLQCKHYQAFKAIDDGWLPEGLM